MAAAAEAKITAAAASAGDLAAVTQAVEQVLLADLPGALGPVLPRWTPGPRSTATSPA